MNVAEFEDELVDRWEALREQGREISAAELCSDCPELLETVAERIRRLQRLGRVLDGDSAPAIANVHFNAQVASKEPRRYSNLRAWAKGGLGEIFLARDEALGREAVIKRIQPAHNTASSRNRFRLEAEITGGLEHPGIVPVYDYGLDEQNQPYYAMRFVQGENLEQALKRFHDPVQGPRDAGERRVAFQKLLRSFLAVCQAVGYAHSRCVVHRDLKPSNIMLGKYGETLVVDWGLAKTTERPVTDETASEVTLVPTCSPSIDDTAIGSVKGSLAYMSPEQAAGQLVEPASDIYSLGATLYSLLTGRLPFEGRNALATIERVKTGKFKRPREVQPTVAPALEAVCLKAMSLQPDDRYATAQDLAADLERWLAGEPVAAWREPWSIRARRWLKRHRTVVTAGVTTLLAAVVMLSVFVVRLQTEKDRLDIANQALADANRKERTAREEAERNLKRSFNQIVEILEVFARPDLQMYSNDPVFQLLEELLQDQLDRFAKEAPQNDFGDSARALNAFDRMYMFNLRHPDGLPEGYYEQLAATRAVLQKRLQQHPDDSWTEVSLGKTYLTEGLRLLDARRAGEARVRIFTAFDLFQKHAVAGDPFGSQCAYSLATVVNSLAFGGLPNTRIEADVILDRIETTLGLLDRFEAAPASPGEENSPHDRFEACIARMLALNAKAGLLMAIPDRRDAARTAAEATLKAAESCPDGWRGHPNFLRFKSIAFLTLAQIAASEKDHLRAWKMIRSSCDYGEQALGLIPGELPMSDRVWNLLMKFNLAEAGADLLRSSDRHDPLASLTLPVVVRDSLAALDTCEQIALSAPESERDLPALATIRDLRIELKRYQAELAELLPSPSPINSRNLPNK